MKKLPCILLHLVIAATLLIATGCKSSQPAATGNNAATSKNTPAPVDEKILKTDCLMADAMTQRQIGNGEKAVTIYYKIIASQPTYAAAYYELGSMMLSAGMADSAVLLTKQAVKNSPDNTWYLLQLAKAYDKKEDYKNEASIWERLIQLHPDELEYYYSLAECLLNNDEAAKSIDVLNRIEKKYGMSETLSMQKKDIWLSIDEENKAVAEIERLAEAMPHETEYSAMMAEIYMKRGNAKKAKHYYDKILANNPNDQYIHLSLASYYDQQGQRDSALAELRIGLKTATIECNDKIRIVTAFFNEEEFYYSQNNEVAELVKEIKQQCPDNGEVCLIYGDLLMHQQHYKEAADELTTSLRADSSRYETWEALLICLNAIDSANTDNSTTLHYAKRAAKLFPLHIMPHYLMGYYALLDKNYAEALKHLQRCEKIGFRRGYMELQTYAMLAECYYYTANNKKAWRYFEACLAIDSTDNGVKNNYAYFLSEQGEQLELAEKMSRQTIVAEPENDTYLDTYAWILHKLGRDDEAMPYINKALKYATDDRDTLTRHREEILKSK